MQLLIDGQNCPGIIIDYCLNVSDQLGINASVIRSRDKDLYKLTSDDYDKELKHNTSYEVLRPTIENMQPGDIVVTGDLDLASYALPRVTAVIDPDGLVYTPERLKQLTVQKYLDKIEGNKNIKIVPITHRDPDLNEQFKQTLIQYLNYIGR